MKRKLLLIPILIFVLATASIGCDTTSNLQQMWQATMTYRVDNVKVIEGGHEDRGLIIRVPRLSNPGESIMEAVLGWSRSWGAVAGIPVDDNDSARFMRSGHMGAKADNIIGAEVDDLLLIELNPREPDVEVDEDESSDEEPEELPETD